MEGVVSLQGSRYLFAKDYQDHEVLRRQMGVLCRNIWGFDFENIYQSGSWGMTFHPYTLFEGDRAISHISATEMDFYLDGEVLHLVQLGTVMTLESERGQGLSRYLLERILEDFEDCDAVFLYANESVLDFYPKFGFEPVNEFPRMVMEDVLARFKKDAGAVMAAERFDALATELTKELLLSLSENNQNGCRFYPVNHRFLVQFYLEWMNRSPIADKLYLMPDGKTVVLAELSDDRVIIRDIYSDCGCELEAVIKALITENTNHADIRLAYHEPYLDMREETGADDLWLLIRGKKAELLKAGRIIFPMTTHT